MNGWSARPSSLAATVACLTLVQFGCKDDSRKTGARISGTVSETKGTPVAGAVIVVDGLGFSCTCDDQGRYTVGPLRSGNYTLVASRPGYRRDTRFNIAVEENQTVSGIDFCLDPDASYIADSIKIEKATPAPGSALRAGTLVRFELTARCSVRNFPFAKVRFTMQDENENALLRYPPGHIITRGERLVPFVQTLRIPDRVAGKIFVAAVLLPENNLQYPIVDFIAYDVRRYDDDIDLPKVDVKKIDGDADANALLRAEVSYKLDLLEEAQLKLTIKCAYRDTKAVDVIKEISHLAKRSARPAGTHVFTVPLKLPPAAGSIIVRADLIVPGKGDVVDYAIHKPVPVPWDLGERMIILDVQEKEKERP